MPFWLARVPSVVVLVASFVLLPLAIDQCSAACEANRRTLPTSDPVCQSALAGSEMGAVPATCGQDHATAAAISTAVAGSDQASRALIAGFAPIGASSLTPSSTTRFHGPDVNGPPPRSTVRVLTTSLRL